MSKRWTRFCPRQFALSHLYLELLVEIATTYQTAGDMQRARNSAMTALARGARSRPSLPQRPGVAARSFVTLNRLGSIAFSNGEATEALKDYEEALGIMRPLTEETPKTRIWQRELAITLDGIGDVKSQTGDARSALAAYDEGLAIIRRLAQATIPRQSGISAANRRPPRRDRRHEAEPPAIPPQRQPITKRG